MARKKAKISKSSDINSEHTIVLPSAETIFGNEDLLAQILLYVPANSLVIFKCVSKAWCRLISNLQFISNHYAKNCNLVSSICSHVDSQKKKRSISLCGRLSIVTLPFLQEVKGRDFWLKHYCNGLALFSNYCVCNLTTKKYKILPENPHGYFNFASHACLAFDPVISPYYKVVLIHDAKSNPTYPVDIYSSQSKLWKRIYVNSAPERYDVVVWDGAINWVNENNDYVRFNVDEEKLLTYQMPKKYKILKWYNIHYFGECAGELVLIQCRRNSLRFNVLAMKRGTCYWNVKYCVDLNPVNSKVLTLEYIVLGMGKESHRSDYVLLLATPRKLISYNLENNSIQVLRSISSEQYNHLAKPRWWPIRHPKLPF